MLRIALSRLLVTILGMLARNTIEIIKRNANKNVLENPLYKNVEDKYATYDSVLLKDIYSGMGSDVKAADLERDNRFNGFLFLLRGLASFNTPQGEAADQLYEMIVNKGSISGLSYGDESELLYKVFSMLDEAPNQALITQAGVSQHYAGVKESQDAFQEIFHTQLDANSALRQMDSASNIRHELEDALRNLFGYVSVMRNQPEYKDLYADLNELIKSAKQSNRQEKGKK